jgi:hypothetical protein
MTNLGTELAELFVGTTKGSLPLNSELGERGERGKGESGEAD